MLLKHQKLTQNFIYKKMNSNIKNIVYGRVKLKLRENYNGL